MNITIVGAHPATPPESQPGSATDTPRPTAGGAGCSAPLRSAARRPRPLRRLPAAGVPGAMCAPECGLLDSCPKDKPAGALAKPACALQDMAGRKFCALICPPRAGGAGGAGAGDAQCGAGASCKAIANVGICTYDRKAGAGEEEGEGHL